MASEQVSGTPRVTGVKLKRKDGRRLQAGALWNLSLGGIFVELGEPLVFGEELVVEFELGGRANPIPCQGFVVWTSKEAQHKAPGKTGAALRLTNLGIGDMRAIAAGVGRSLDEGGRR